MEDSMERESQPETLVVRLLDAGLVSLSQVQLAATEQRRRGGTVSRMLCELGFVPPDLFAAAIAEEAGIPMVDASRLRMTAGAVSLLPPEQARRLKVIPLSRRDGIVTVAMANPGDVMAVDQLRQTLGCEIEILVAQEREILNALDATERPGPGVQAAITRWLAEEPTSPNNSRPLDRMEESLGQADAPVVQLVQEVLVRAVEASASDVHFEPAENWLRIRLRIDGVLLPDVLIPKPLQPAVIARLKVLGDLDIAESRRPQDGRSTLLVNRRRINLRISSLPTQHGESVVVRLLPAESAVPTLAQLELEPAMEILLQKAIARPHGVVIVTGPTGSGKTTTLYAMLNELNRPDTAVFTLEDPVEMPLAGARQTQIHEEAGLTYSIALRALLRQDPDVILVGETRDTETAQLMIRAALTGHQILTTLHTNDELGAIPRLIDMGVERCLLPGSIGAVLAQRLVRRLCPLCRESVLDPVKFFEDSGVVISENLRPRAWQARGCPECRNTGFRGRRAVFELFAPDARFHDLLVKSSAHSDLVRHAREAGMRSMLENGLAEVLKGVTTLEELQQATRFD